MPGVSDQIAIQELEVQYVRVWSIRVVSLPKGHYGVDGAQRACSGGSEERSLRAVAGGRAIGPNQQIRTAVGGYVGGHQGAISKYIRSLRRLIAYSEERRP